MNKIKYIPTEVLKKYAECDREKDVRTAYTLMQGANLDKLTENIKSVGFKEPLKLAVYDNNTALLYEGNHRICSALRLKIENCPVIIEHVNELHDEGLKMYLKDLQSKAVDMDELTMSILS